ncbi:UNVERIFIED_CONTAM: hypothetical protein Sradi_3353900 [Sesamum radiatum]|uniref:Uncharacterized protein n=1 Tax=Sesamum radiatum TaxID=300843 RepID=A0AAW2R2D5_SESRA
MASNSRNFSSNSTFNSSSNSTLSVSSMSSPHYIPPELVVRASRAPPPLDDIDVDKSSELI